MRTTNVLPTFTLSLSILAACGGGGDGDDDGSGSVDARADVDARAPDGGGGGGGPDAPPGACTAPASLGDVGTLQAEAYFIPDVDEGTDDGANDDLLVMIAPLDGGASPDLIELRLYAGYGAFAGGAVRTGTFQLTGPELDIFECGICAAILTDATAEDYADDYLPTGGTLELSAIGTAAGQTLTGRLTNLTFQHVLIAEDGTTTPAPGNCTTTLGSASFSAALMADPGGGKP